MRDQALSLSSRRGLAFVFGEALLHRGLLLLQAGLCGRGFRQGIHRAADAVDVVAGQEQRVIELELQVRDMRLHEAEVPEELILGHKRIE